MHFASTVLNSKDSALKEIFIQKIKKTKGQYAKSLRDNSIEADSGREPKHLAQPFTVQKMKVRFRETHSLWTHQE